jgi:hypothetical protein
MLNLETNATNLQILNDICLIQKSLDSKYQFDELSIIED